MLTRFRLGQTINLRNVVRNIRIVHDNPLS